MSLIESEQDDREVLRAEDEAIWAAAQGEQPETAIPTGQALADLINELSHDASHATTEG